VEAEEPSQNTALLEDIRDVFDATDEPYIRSAALVASLIAMPERPWGECNHGKALAQNGLARRLKPFKVRTEDVGPEANRNKGYLRRSFDDAFSRYIPGFQSAQPSSTHEPNDLDENQSAQEVFGCADENRSNSLNSNGLRDCADDSPLNGEREGNGDVGGSRSSCSGSF
jgi:uncharacterized protein DUF3631